METFHLADREPVAAAIAAAAACDTLDGLYAAIRAYRGTEASGRVPFVPGSPARSPNPIMIVAEKGEPEDLETGRPFSGDWGRVMRAALERFRIADGDVHVAWACHYPPSQEEAPNATNVAASRPWIFREIEIVRPRAVLMLGRVVLDSLFGYRGKLTPMLGQTMLWRRGGTSVECYAANSPALAARFKASVPGFELQVREFLEWAGMPDGTPFDAETHDVWWREAA